MGHQIIRVKAKNGRFVINLNKVLFIKLVDEDDILRSYIYVKFKNEEIYLKEETRESLRILYDNILELF